MKYDFKKKLKEFLNEDIGKGDISSSLLPNKKIDARIISKQRAIVAGITFAKSIFDMNKCKTKILKCDGDEISPGQIILVVSGSARSVLACERTVLNLLSRMSGIATYTNNLVKTTKKINPKMEIYATRKTAPGLRFFDKKAVEIGGGKKHRVSLDDMVLLKDNHIFVFGSIRNIIRKAKRKYKTVEIEVENQKDAIIAAESGAEIIMLDNFSPNLVNSTIKKLKEKNMHKKIKIEVSGGVNHTNIRKYAKTEADFISVGAITSSVIGVDISLDVSDV